MGVSNGDGDGGGVDGDGSGGNSPSGQSAGQRLLSPETCLRRRRSFGTFRGLMLDDLGFSRDGEDIGGRARSVEARGAHTTPRRGPGGGRAQALCGRPAALLRLPPGQLLRHGKNWNFGLRIVQFREYFLCNFSETKNIRKQELALWHLVNRLVPKNA